MEQITIQVRNKQKARALKDFLKSLDFVEDVSAKDISLTQAQNRTDDNEFFSLAGLWAGRDVTLDSIRQKAWPSRA